MEFPQDYAERVYAGVLGKIIGVYLGRPFEGASYEWLTERFGEISEYVHGALGKDLIVSDDDISGTFTFLRALEDYEFTPDLTPAQIGQTWLNYLIDGRTILWWGGMGRSTEHTAYLRLKQGIAAPASGSIACNGHVVAEQIGAQIFIDGWGLVNPGDPERAADFARRAGSVSHDGEAIYGAQVVAALVAAAFIEHDIDRLLDTAVALIPKDSTIYRLIADVRSWRLADNDWRKTRARIAASYGYDKFGGGCHMVPNHALIILALVYSRGKFGKAMTIVNTSGWDTDCNSGNVGCILGVLGGLAGLEDSADWRGPVADRLYLPTAAAGGVSDAVAEANSIVRAGRNLHGAGYVPPKDGARFSFCYPGSVHGFTRASGLLHLGNAAGDGLRLEGVGVASTPTFVPKNPNANHGSYAIPNSPTLTSGQTVRARLLANAGNALPVTVSVAITSATGGASSPVVQIAPGQAHVVEWAVPDTGGVPIDSIGLVVDTSGGALTLDWLTWDGAPNSPLANCPAALSAWVESFDSFEPRDREAVWALKNSGRGVGCTGTRDWEDYSYSGVVNIHMAKCVGLAVRVQGQERYYALLLTAAGEAQLVKRLDGETLLAHAPLAVEYDRDYAVTMTVRSTQITASLDGRALFDITDTARPLRSGGVGIVVEDGNATVREARVGA